MKIHTNSANFNIKYNIFNIFLRKSNHTFQSLQLITIHTNSERTDIKHNLSHSPSMKRKGRNYI